MNALLALTLVALTAAPPDTGSLRAKRLAVVVGSNRAAPGRTPLRYAHQDAHNLASVLIEAGQFLREDVVVLEDPEPSHVLAVLDSRLERLGKEGREGLLLFYYSGHSDERALYPNGQPLELKALRARLEDERAAVRVGILDACQGGSWTRAKGLTPAAPFAVEMPLALSSEGSVLLASSTGQEASHETDALRGSFFTHHLVAGLRGAADEGDDGQVTVGEAFAYAQRLTIRDTSLHGDAVQHPSFDLRLRGRQDLPLTRLASASSTLEVRQELGPLQVIQLHSGLVVLEVPEGRRALRMALPVGPYLVRRRTPQGTFAREAPGGGRQDGDGARGEPGAGGRAGARRQALREAAGRHPHHASGRHPRGAPVGVGGVWRAPGPAVHRLRQQSQPGGRLPRGADRPAGAGRERTALREAQLPSEGVRGDSLADVLLSPG
ncbi:caspase family protein [Archangium gephyra]|uniref:caspase family protein n=1 Tax=Archangium gephyra TaxID=48 RepID=UPI003B78EB95